jgi:phage-related protein
MISSSGYYSNNGHVLRPAGGATISFIAMDGIGILMVLIPESESATALKLNSIEYFHYRVSTEIESWPDGILADYVRILELLMEFGPNLRMPHSQAMGGGVFEMRPHGREGIGRAFYCFVVGQRIVILHAFIKKTQATPQQELKIARKRMKEVRNG